jgi:hypothetical protein
VLTTKALLTGFESTPIGWTQPAPQPDPIESFDSRVSQLRREQGELSGRLADIQGREMFRAAEQEALEAFGVAVESARRRILKLAKAKTEIREYDEAASDRVERGVSGAGGANESGLFAAIGRVLGKPTDPRVRDVAALYIQREEPLVDRDWEHVLRLHDEVLSAAGHALSDRVALAKFRLEDRLVAVRADLVAVVEATGRLWPGVPAAPLFTKLYGFPNVDAESSYANGSHPQLGDYARMLRAEFEREGLLSTETTT